MKVPMPPRLNPVSLDCCFDQGSGWQAIPAARGFSGDDLTYSVTCGTARIDPQTGMMLVPTGRPHDGETIRVQAENGAGVAEIQVQVTVEDDGVRAPVAPLRELAVDGVVFRFAQEAPVGRFISGALGLGDPFVIGPVTLDSYSPAPAVAENGRPLNGAMLNPPCDDETGFGKVGGGGSPYDADLNAGLRLPLRLEPGDALVVQVSRPDAERSRNATDRFVVLTCLAEAPFEDAFRPPYSGPDRPIWRLSDIRFDRLPTLTPTGLLRGTAEQLDYERRAGRFTFDIVPTWDRNYLGSPHHPPLYGRDLCNDTADPLLWVITDRPLEDKIEVLIGLVQRGIDRYGIFLSALEREALHPWLPDGAHNSGRKLSILFAGQLLDDDRMLSLMRQSRTLTGGFQEDEMTFYVTPEIVEISNSDAWAPPYEGDAQYPKQPYTEGMIGMPDWRGRGRDTHVNAAWTGHLYRVSGNHNTQHAQVLTLLAMGLREAWDHDAYFDYHMRFCAIQAGRPDPWRFRGTGQALYDPVIGSDQGQVQEPWEQYWRSPWSWQMLMAHVDTFYSYPWS